MTTEQLACLCDSCVRRFVEEAVANEREACAKVVESHPLPNEVYGVLAKLAIAEAIRART